MIDGVAIHRMQPFLDGRGRFVECFRESWGLLSPVQWNMGTSVANCLRGVHVHVRHTDFVTVAAGAMLLGLQDLRPASPTFGRATTVEIRAEDPLGVLVPTGVAHGFLFGAEAVYLVGVSHYWDEADELGCHWQAPGLVIPWEPGNPMLSDRDASAGTLDELVDQVLRAPPPLGPSPRP